MQDSMRRRVEDLEVRNENMFTVVFIVKNKKEYEEIKTNKEGDNIIIKVF